MTTIAWDGKVLATDSQGNAGEYKSGEHIKKLYRNIGPFQAVAMAGQISLFPIVLEAFKDGCIEDIIPLDVTAVCIHLDGRAVHYDGAHGHFEKWKPKTATGSGWALATAAMRGGADAAKALRICCSLDMYSGGRVQKFVAKG